MTVRSAFIALIGVLCGQGVAGAAPTNFSAGSLIIPMDACYQPSKSYLCNQPDMTTCTAQTQQVSTYYGGACPDTSGIAYDGVLKAYGLVYRLIEKGIPIYYIVETDTTKKNHINDTDLTITLGAGHPVSLLNHSTGATSHFMNAAHTSIAYRGAPFLISATDAAAAIALIKTDAIFTANDPRTSRGMFQDVYIHYANTNIVGAPVKAILSTVPPKIAMVDIAGAAIGVLEGYLKDAGLYTATSFAAYPAVGDVFTQFKNVTDFTGGGLNTTFQILWAPHWATAAMTSTDFNNVMSSIKTFNQAGHPVVAQCQSLSSIEGADAPAGTTYDPTNANGHFMVSPASGTTTGLLVNQIPSIANWPSGTAGEGIGVNPTNTGAIWSNPLVQTGDFPLYVTTPTAAHTFDFVPKSGDAYKAGVSRLVATIAPGSEASLNGLDLEATLVDPAGKNGDIIYVGGHGFATQYSGCGAGTTFCGGHDNGDHVHCTDAGISGMCSGNCCAFPVANMIGMERLVLNTLVFLGQPSSVVELTRSSPMVYSDNTTFIGTYELASAPASTYPAWNGHFRKYASGALSGTNVTAYSGITALWDSAASITSQASHSTRTMFTAVPVSGKLTHQAFDTVAGDVTKLSAYAPTLTSTNIASIIAGGLGGIDHSIPAVIGPSAFAGSGTRPTVAYVGGLDGMLHCFLAQSASYTSLGGTVYKSGDELWAFIPPNQLNSIAGRTAIVDGSPNVADVNVDLGNGLGKKWYTVLAITGGFDTGLGGGGVDLLDVTDPDPFKAKFLWESSDTFTQGGHTFIMGRAQGAAIQPAMTAFGLKYAVFLSTDNSTGTWGNGFNMYALDVINGSVIWRFNHTYSYDTAHNDVPATLSAIDTSGNNGAANQVFFGDVEGRVWEIPSSGPSGTPAPIFEAPNKFSTIGDINYPIESAVSLYRDPNNSHLSILGVTGGADWVASATQTQIFKLDLTSNPPAETTIASITDRVYAVPTISGQNAYFITSAASIQGGNTNSYNAAGALHRVDLVTNSDSVLASGLKQGASEVTLDSSGSVYAASAVGITVNANSGADASKTTYKIQMNTSAKPLQNQAWLDFH